MIQTILLILAIVIAVIAINICTTIVSGIYRNYWLKDPYLIDPEINQKDLRLALEISPHTIKVTYTFYDANTLNEHSTSIVKFFYTPKQMHKALNPLILQLIHTTQENYNVYTD